MKAKLFLSILLIFTITMFSTSSFANNSKTEIDKEEFVDLMGSLATGMLRSSSSPFEVTKNSYAINISYQDDLSNIYIEISNEYGQILYHSKVNPVTGGQLNIDISGLSKGNYIISFSNDKGGYIYGEFEVIH